MAKLKPDGSFEGEQNINTDAENLFDRIYEELNIEKPFFSFPPEEEEKKKSLWPWGKK